MLPPLIPRETLFGNPQRALAQISPNGLVLGYLAPQDNVLNIWVRETDGTDRVVSKDRKRGIRNFMWQPDSVHIIYLQDTDGDENWHVYQVNIRSGTTRDLTPFLGVQAQMLGMDHRFPDLLLVSMNLRDPRLHEVYRVDLKTGAIHLDTENPGDVIGWEVDNQLRVRAATVQLPDGGTEIRVRSQADSPWTTLDRWGPDETFGGVAGFTPDDTRVLLITSVDANAARLVEVDLATGRRRVLAQDPQFDASQTLHHPKTHALEAVQFVRARSEWEFLNPDLKPDFEALRQVRDGDPSIVSRDLEDKVWIVQYLNDNGPIYYYRYERATKHADLLFSSRPDLEQYTLARMNPIQFTARDGMTIHGYLTLPPGLEPRQLPTILLVHGGPWARDVWGFDPAVQWMANRGYAVLQINFRGSTGYGKDYLNAGNREWAGRMHTDLLDGKAWAIAQGYTDPARVAIYGGSYGGYATLVGLAFTPGEFACGVDVVGPSNLSTLIRSIPPYWAPLRSVFDRRVGNVDTEEDFLHSRSPLFRAERIAAPLLIAQGANDPRVKQAESDQIVDAMRKNNRTVEYIVFEDEGHGFARPENRLRFYGASEAFLARHLGGRSESATRAV